MSRTIVSEQALIEWMNLRLHQSEEFKNCHFTYVRRSAENDEIGCNWSTFGLQCSGIPADICGPKASIIAGEAQKLFNLEVKK